MRRIYSKLKDLARPYYAPASNYLHAMIYGPRRYRYLYEAIAATKAVRIMEIGTWRGDRAREMIQVAARFHPISAIEYYGFDLFEELNQSVFEHEISKWPLPMEEVRARLEETGAQVHLFRGNTSDVLPSVVRTLPPMDFIFIDGGHSRETVQNDWNCSLELMHENTIVLFDDYWPHNDAAGAKPIVDAIDRGEYVVEVLPIVDTFDNKDFGTLSIQFARVCKKA